ncbi:MAG TPA: hypothetical protein VEA78_06600, partial [Acidimicrobiales bacterium]|nr:hypothetical protein [Acidimicrobiales bacterium]
QMFPSVSELRSVVSALSPEAMSGADAVRGVEIFGELERLAAAGKALCAARVASTSAWAASGDRSPADWLAKQTGSTVAAARGALKVAESLTPEVDDALRSGALSMVQAEAITSAGDDHSRLVEMAQCQSLKKLRDECARLRARHVDMAAREKQIHEERFFRQWTDAGGTACGMYRTTAAIGAEIARLIKPYADAAFEAARKAGEREPSESYAHDGLVAALRNTDTVRETKRRRREAIVMVNLETLQRGHVHDDETCEIPGVGPVSVDTARDLLGDALLRIVITDGIDVQTVVHAGRCASDAQKTAIQVRQRGQCVRPGCSKPISQIDHIEGWTITGPVTIDQLAGLCDLDHVLKTNERHTYRRTEHGWEGTRPDGTVERERPPPQVAA